MEFFVFFAVMIPLVYAADCEDLTQRRKGAETQGFRLLGTITRWVSHVNLFFPVISLSLAPLPPGVFALTAVFRFIPSRPAFLRVPLRLCVTTGLA